MDHGLQRVKRDLLQSKETYYSVKRDLLQCQKGPTTVSKETYYNVKRDLLQYRHTRRRTRKASRAGLNLNLKTLNPGPKTGVHARRTRNASPVGDLFKKACDNIGCVFVVLRSTVFTALLLSLLLATLAVSLLS